VEREEPEDTQYDWSAFHDDDGRLFYYNTKTGESAWDPPEEGFNPFGEVSSPREAYPVENEIQIAQQVTKLETREDTVYNQGIDIDVSEKEAALSNDRNVDKTESRESESDDHQETVCEHIGETVSSQCISDPEKISHWSAMYDDQGKLYYYNSQSGESAWELLAEGNNPTEGNDHPSVLGDESNPMVDQADKQKVHGSSSLDDIIHDWSAFYDEEGRLYFFNSNTGESSWDAPAEGFNPPNHTSGMENTESVLVQNTRDPDEKHDADKLIDDEDVRGTNVNMAPIERQRLSSNKKHWKAGRPAHTVVSFGFGGRFCQLRTDLNQSRIVVIRRNHTLVRNLAIRKIEESKQKFGICGPLSCSRDADALSYIEEKAASKSDLLWQLINIASTSHGRLRSSVGINDPSSPETKIVDMLTGEMRYTENGDAHDITHSSRDSSTSGLAKIENLLLRGHAEKAVDEAIRNEMYATAILLGTMCSFDVYQHAVKCFADHEFSPGRPLHSMAYMFSRQLDPGSYWNKIDLEILRKTWKKHLAIILCNRTESWEKVILSLGDRLADFGDTFAAHCCYMICGLSVGGVGTRMSLLGHEAEVEDLLLASEHAIEALERTEAYEWAKYRGKATFTSLLPFKIVYALLLVDYGYEQAAKRYIENIYESLEYTQVDQRTPSNVIPLSTLVLSYDRHGLVSFLNSLDNRLSRSSIEINEGNDVNRTLISEFVEENELDSSFVTAQTNVKDSQFLSGQTNSTGKDSVVHCGDVNDKRSRREPKTDSSPLKFSEDKIFNVKQHTPETTSLTTRDRRSFDSEASGDIQRERDMKSVSHTKESPSGGSTIGADISSDNKTSKIPSKPLREIAPMSAPANLENVKMETPASKSK
jgi:hypothetical protein